MAASSCPWLSVSSYVRPTSQLPVFKFFKKQSQKVDDPELIAALQDFVGAFEVVFRYDWPYTKIAIGDEEDGHTFIEPGLGDETEDWGSRGALLEKYRRLVAVMKARGLPPSFPFPLDRLPDFTKRVW